MTLSPAQLQKVERPLWFCVKTHPKQEQLAAIGLRLVMGLQCFAPRIRFRRATRRGPVYFVEAMFPGYVFARFDFLTMYRQVQSSQGVAGLVRFGDRVAVLPDEVIGELQRIIGDSEVLHLAPELSVGSEVRIVEGPFQGLEAVVKQLLPSRDRVRVLLEFLGSTVEAELPEHALISGKPQPRMPL